MGEWARQRAREISQRFIWATEMWTGFDDGREYQTFPQLIIIAKRTYNIVVICAWFSSFNYTIWCHATLSATSRTPASPFHSHSCMFACLLFCFLSYLIFLLACLLSRSDPPLIYARLLLYLYIYLYIFFGGTLFVYYYSARCVITFCLAVVKVVCRFIFASSRGWHCSTRYLGQFQQGNGSVPLPYFVYVYMEVCVCVRVSANECEKERSARDTRCGGEIGGWKSMFYFAICLNVRI